MANTFRHQVASRHRALFRTGGGIICSQARNLKCDISGVAPTYHVRPSENVELGCRVLKLRGVQSMSNSFCYYQTRRARVVVVRVYMWVQNDAK